MTGDAYRKSVGELHIKKEVSCLTLTNESNIQAGPYRENTICSGGVSDAIV
jgi:hypothetical protein